MYEFGNWVTRSLRGGTKLQPAEQWLLGQLVAALPEHLKTAAEIQLRSYNLAQREIDGRAINFYRRPSLLPEMPLLPMSIAEAPLIRLAARTAMGEQVHAALHAVSGRVFCMTLDRSAQDIAASGLTIIQVTEAWRSNFPARA